MEDDEKTLIDLLSRLEPKEKELLLKKLLLTVDEHFFMVE